MKKVVVFATIVVVLAGISARSSEAKSSATLVAKQQYYHADGYIKAIGKNARRTIYSPNPHTRRKWQGALKYLHRVRHQAYITLHPPAPRVSSVPQIIVAVFGAAAPEALHVALCESHYYTGATNGQYFGIFQMGSSERARFGGSSLDPWDQVRAAYRYYSVAGWGPWACA
jgi:hypothetical protein